MFLRNLIFYAVAGSVLWVIAPATGSRYGRCAGGFSAVATASVAFLHPLQKQRSSLITQWLQLSTTLTSIPCGG